MSTTGFAETQANRTREYHSRRAGDVLVPLNIARMALARLQENEEAVLDLAKRLEAGEDILPKNFVVRKGNQRFLNLSLARTYEHPETVEMRKIPGAAILFDLLEQDASLRGADSSSRRRFREKREKVKKRTAHEVIGYNVRAIDFYLELADADSKHTHEIRDIKEAFESLRVYSQEIVNRLFVAAGLKRFRPIVHITKSLDFNAFVFSDGHEKMAREYLSSSGNDDQQIDLPIFINFGLLANLENDNELPAILAHEFSHLLQPEYLSEVDDSARRRMEYDADRTGMHLADAAGFNPRGLIDLFSRLGDGMPIKIGWGTHPPTESRRIELEKEFNSRDTLFPNASKPICPLPHTVREAVAKISKEYKRYVPEVALPRFDDLKHFFEQENGVHVFMGKGIEDNVSEICHRKVTDLIARHELANGALGYRDDLFKRLKLFALLLKKVEAMQQSGETQDPIVFFPKIGYIHHMDERDIGAITGIEDYLKPGESLEKYKLKEDQKIDFARMTEPGIVADTVGAGMARLTADDQLEDWLRGSNQDIEFFWQKVAANERLRVLTRPQRLYYLHKILSSFVGGDRNYHGRSDIDHFEIILRNIKTPRAVESVSRLDAYGGTRSHQRRQRSEEPADARVGELTYLFAIKPGLTSFRPNWWHRSPEKQAPMFRDLEQVIQKKTVETYKDYLKKDGFKEEIEDDVYFFVLSHLFTRGGTFLFRDWGKSLSIEFLDKAIKILEQKDLKSLPGFPVETLESYANLPAKQSELIRSLMGVIAFGLKPKNKAEEALCAHYLKRISIDPFVFTKNEYDETILLYEPRYTLSEEERGLWRCPFASSDNENICICDKEGGVCLQIKGDRCYTAALGSAWVARGEELRNILHSGSPDSLHKFVKKGEQDFDSREGDTQQATKAVVELISMFDNKTKSALKKISAFCEEKYVVYLALARKYLNFLYEEGMLNNRELKALYDHGERLALEPLAGVLAEEIINELKVKNPTVKFDIENLRIKIKKHIAQEGVKWGELDRLERAQELIPIIAPEFNSLLTSVSTDPGEIPDGVGGFSRFFYRAHDRPLSRISYDHYSGNTSVYIGNRNYDRVCFYVKQIAEGNPVASELFAELTQLPKTLRTVEILNLFIGNLAPFDELQLHNPGLIRNNFSYFARILRMAAKVHHQEWKKMEHYKRLDEQLSHWEWIYDNPLIGGRVEERDARLGDKRIKKIRAESKDGKLPSLTEYFTDNFSDILKGKYKIDAKNLSGVKFSWPLLLDDLWAGREVFPASSDESQESKDLIADGKKILAIILEKLKAAVNDPLAIEKAKRMQAGFFREFIIAKHLELKGVSSLEHLEEWLPYFDSFSHEASKRNQLSAQVEARKKDVRDEIKRALMFKAIEESNVAEGVSVEKNFEISTSHNYLSQRACTFSVKWNRPDRDRIDYGKVEQFSAQIYRRYEELLEEELRRMDGLVVAQEADAKVFSDHVIEDGKSKLEIGPCYRLRFIAQPLMDWHAAELRQTKTLSAVEALSERVERDLPETHPLKDLFVLNQMHAEVWALLNEEVGDAELARLGIKWQEKNIDLANVLRQFPLYADVSFLKRYSIFEVEGLFSSIDKLPEDVAKRIHAKVAGIVENKISIDAYSGMRRLLFQIEERIFWPDYRRRAGVDSDAADEYLSHILEYYPDASWERDDLIQRIVLPLASKLEQIQRIRGLTYREQIRWPDQQEKASLKQQHEGFEKARAMLSMLDIAQKSEYLLWFLGGEEPVAERLSIQKTGVSLQGRKDYFWQLSATERRLLLYDSFLGKEGLLEPMKESRFSHTYAESMPWPHWENEKSMIEYFTGHLFDQIFGEQLIDESLPREDRTNMLGRRILRTIFTKLFTEQSQSARRAELCVNIIEAVGTATKEGKKMAPPELVRLLLEQVGVMGVKVGQILSEQPGLLPTKIQEALERLKDSTPGFSKDVTLIYLQAAGLVGSGEGNIAEIRENLGSASIKQVDVGVDASGKKYALKQKKPSADKHFDSDIEVLKSIVTAINAVLAEEKTVDRSITTEEVPVYLVGETREAVKDELLFRQEVQNQLALQDSLERRNAKLKLAFNPRPGEQSVFDGLVLIKTAKIKFPSTESEEDVGLICEERVNGFSLKDLTMYQQALIDDDEAVLSVYRQRSISMYGKSRLEDIEDKVGRLNLDKLHASLGLEMLRQINNGGVFHADLHSGNFMIDFTPETKGEGQDKELYVAKGFFIDLGSAGYSKYGAMPANMKERYPENYSASEDFRDFLSALFGITIKYDVLGNIVSRYSGMEWTGERIRQVLGQETDTGQRVKKIMYAILENKENKLDPQFRYFLKAVASSANHLDKLKSELAGGDSETLMNLYKEKLLNFNLLA